MTTGRINQVDARAETRRKANQLPRFAVTIGTQKTELRRRKAQKRNPVEKGRASQTMGEATRATLRQFCLCAPIDAPFTERIHLNVSMERHYMSHAHNGTRRLAAVAGR